MGNVLSQEELQDLEIQQKHIPSEIQKWIEDQIDDMSLQDLACQPCNEEGTQDIEEAIIAKGIFKPLRPTVKEVEEHNLTHLPYRNWCIFCVKGKAKDDPPRRKSNKMKIKISQ